MTGIAQTLEAITNHVRSLEEVRKRDVRSGDPMMVTTWNSLYTLWALSDRHFLVWGGWFALRLEFENRGYPPPEANQN